jgi:hypothetical protein
MARPTNRLSTLTIKKNLPPGLYADGGGLYMQVSQQATKAWIFRFTRAGRARKMGLGPVSTKPDDKRITLADARQKAAAARSLLIDGIDPITARDAKRAQAALADAHAVTFKHCAVHSGQQGKLEKRGSPAPMGVDAENLRSPRNRAFAGGRRRHSHGFKDPAAHLEHQAGNSESRPRSH